WRKVNWAATGRTNGGLSSSLSPAAAASAENAELGGVSLVSLEVVQADCEPEATVLQPSGSAGAVTPSKFCSNGAVWPSTKLNETVPRLAAPSCNCSAAVSVAPQFPMATKVKGNATVVLALSAP